MTKLKKLKALFEGKKVKITSTDKGERPVTGICETIYAAPNQKNFFDLKLKSGNRYGFSAKIVTETSVEGKHGGMSGGSRKIELI